MACSASTMSSSLRSRRAGEVGDRRLAAELAPQLLARLLERQAELLQVARRAHVPGGVAEVAPQLAEDRRHRVGREREPALGVPAVDGLDEADGRDLDQVVERLAGAPVAQRQRAGERHVALDQRLAGALVAALDEPHEPLILALPPGAIDRGGRSGAWPLGRNSLCHLKKCRTPTAGDLRPARCEIVSLLDSARSAVDDVNCASVRSARTAAGSARPRRHDGELVAVVPRSSRVQRVSDGVRPVESMKIEPAQVGDDAAASRPCAVAQATSGSSSATVDFMSSSPARAGLQRDDGRTASSIICPAGPVWRALEHLGPPRGPAAVPQRAAADAALG